MANTGCVTELFTDAELLAMMRYDNEPAGLMSLVVAPPHGIPQHPSWNTSIVKSMGFFDSTKLTEMMKKFLGENP